MHNGWQSFVSATFGTYDYQKATCHKSRRQRKGLISLEVRS